MAFSVFICSSSSFALFLPRLFVVQALLFVLLLVELQTLIFHLVPNMLLLFQKRCFVLMNQWHDCIYFIYADHSNEQISSRQH